MKAALLILGIMLVNGCASVSQRIDPSKNFRKDIDVQFGTEHFEGAAVLPKQASYPLILKPKGDMDLLMVKSCHREIVVEKASSGGLFSKNEYRFTYSPVPGIEGTGICPLSIDALESGSNQYSGFFLDFESEEFKLKFAMACNGSYSEPRGVAVCQARKGTIQVLQFSDPIRFAPQSPDSCPKPEFRAGKYEIPAASGPCHYMFDTQDHRVGRLTLLGYDDVVLRRN